MTDLHDKSAQLDESAEAAPATGCCRPVEADPRIARYFNRRNERRRSGREKYEMGKVTERLLDVLVERRPAGRSVLEGGCGPGALLISLLDAGAASGTGIDLSAEAITYARERAAKADVAERVEFIVGDAALTPAEQHDWVVLDKVICCYPHMDALLARTVNEAKSLYAFAVPVSWGWRGGLARTLLGIEAVTLRLLRRACPAYVHDVRAIEARLTSAGFGSILSEELGWWHIGVFAR
jgi:magnesium-protoporphyrin O-methyltransferase